MSIYAALLNKQKKISVTGLGYVGLPMALELARKYSVIGYDINPDRVAMMKMGEDPSGEIGPEDFVGCDILFTNNPRAIDHAHFHIVTVPTDVDAHQVPNLEPLLVASRNIGKALKPGDYVVYEATVYPGCTEEDCLPILENESGLSLFNEDIETTDYFRLGYSPERIVPGHREFSFKSIKKIVSGDSIETRDQIGRVYNEVLDQGFFSTSSIKVAEAAKIIENTQRDINISLMNELAIIFDQLGLDTNEVIEAASTKWNFHSYKPGLVGGHCIGVDPYYLLHKARELGLDPQVIAAGRRVNNYIPSFIASKVVQSIISTGVNPNDAKVLILGVTFKENVTDVRNSKVFDLISELSKFSINADVMDKHASMEEVSSLYGIDLIDTPSGPYNAIIIAVAHDEYIAYSKMDLEDMAQQEVFLFDIKGVLRSKNIENYWSL